MKRLFDILFVLAMAWLWVPMLVVTALAVLLIDGRPVFFLHERAGRGGKPFKVYKFRTMAQAEDGELVVTGLGRWLRRLSLDEVPQLVNVLVGDMSLVGPRPPLPSEVMEYLPWHKMRLAVKPGLTCHWQVSGRSNIGFEDWMRLDNDYVRHGSLKTDMKLLGKTFKAVVKGDGAY